MRRVACAMMLLAAFASHACPALARKGPAVPEFKKYGYGCWNRTDEKGFHLQWCFQVGGIVKSDVSSEHLGYEDEGIFRVGPSEIVILGFPGSGWPASDYVERCKYHFEEDGRVLALDGCGTGGRWVKSEDGLTHP